jgi:delta 1-pyrroline-5-carboxylate dehydrogenase
MSEQVTQTSDDLVGMSAQLEKLADTILRAAEGRRPLPMPQGDILKQLAELATECEEMLDGEISKEASKSLAAALSAIRSGLDSLVVYAALEGTSYETRTVAND